MGDATEYQLPDLTGGLNSIMPASKIADNQTPACLNVQFDRGGIDKRDGFTRIVNDALEDPGLHFNGLHGHVQIVAHDDFDYGTQWEIVIKFRLDAAPGTDERWALYSHGHAGSGFVDAGTGTLDRAIYIYVDDTPAINLVVTYADGSNTINVVTHASTLSADTNYAVHCRRTGASGDLEVDVWNIDTGAAVGSTASTSAAVTNGQFDASAFPILIGAAPVIDSDLPDPQTLKGVDATGGKRFPQKNSDDRGAAQEYLDGTIGEVQVWKDINRTPAVANNARLDTQDADISSSTLLGYWMFNEGDGTTVACNTNYGINEATSKDGTILGYRPQFVAGLVGGSRKSLENPTTEDGKRQKGVTRHAIQFNGIDQYLHVIDQDYALLGTGGNYQSTGILDSLLAQNNPLGSGTQNPWTVEFSFQFHKNSDEYNFDRKQCLCSFVMRFTDDDPTADEQAPREIPFLIFYLDTSEKLNVDVLVAVANDDFAVDYETLKYDTALTKDTTYHVALMHYENFQTWQLYVDGQPISDSGSNNGWYHAASASQPDIDTVVKTSNQFAIYLGMHNDKFLEEDVSSIAAGIGGAGRGLGGYRSPPDGITDDTDDLFSNRGGAALPSHCTIDEFRIWAGEDSGGTPVGARSGDVGSDNTNAVPSGENPPNENLIAKYYNAEIIDAEIRDKVGLWLYLPFYEDWVDYENFGFSHQWITDQSRFRYLNGLLVPASTPPVWGTGCLPKTTVDTDYANNSLVHNPVGAIELIHNYVQDDGTQELLHVQSSTLRSFTTGNSYTDYDDGFKKGTLGTAVTGKDYCYITGNTLRPTRWDGSNLQTMGIPPPTVAPYTAYLASFVLATNEGGLLNNKYYTYRYTFYNKDKNLESDPSPESAALFTNPTKLSLGSSDNREIVLIIPWTKDPQVTHIRLYRSEPLNQLNGDETDRSSAVGSFWNFIAEFEKGSVDPNIGNTNSPGTDQYTDGTVEAALGPQLTFRNAPPPQDPKYITLWRERTWVANTTDHPSRVYFSEAGQPEYYHPENFIEFDEGDGQPITALVPLFNLLLVFKANKISYITEDGGSVSGGFIDFPFSKFVHHTNVGCASHWTAQKLDENLVMFMGQKGVYATDGVRVEYLSHPIENEFRDNLSKSVLGDAMASIYKKRNQYILVVSMEGGDNDTALVYDYVFKTWTKWDMRARFLTQTEDSTGVERIFQGGTETHGYLSRWDSGETDGGDILRPANATEPDELTGSAVTTSGTTTTLIGSGTANWDTVSGDMCRGMRLYITQSGTQTKHTVVFTDTAGMVVVRARLTFYPPTDSAVTAGDTYILCPIDAQWESKEFHFGQIRDAAQVKYLDVFQEAQDDSDTFTAFLKVNRGSYQQNAATPSLDAYQARVPFIGTKWPTAGSGGNSRGLLVQFKLQQQSPNRPFRFQDLVIEYDMYEGDK